MASSGLLTMINVASGDRAAISLVTLPTIFILVLIRSSRLIPGLRAMPAVMMTTSEPALGPYSLQPSKEQSYPCTGPACIRSKAFPWGMPSTISTSTTSAIFFSANLCAAVDPTLPAPTTVTFFLIVILLYFLIQFSDNNIYETNRCPLSIKKQKPGAGY